jgi:hypothetical protein
MKIFLSAVSGQFKACRDALARQLGGLALAVEQAGAYIAQRHISLANYLRTGELACLRCRSGTTRNS